MKKFYYKIDKEKVSRTYGGATVTASVFKLTRQELKKIGELEWNTRSYKGEQSEVFTFLIDKKQLPKSAYNWSKSNQGSGGYYFDRFEKEHGVSIEQL